MEARQAQWLQRNVFATYWNLRLGMAVIAVAFPLLLLIGGRVLGVEVQDSMSAYYHATSPSGYALRDWFVGILFALGVCLWLYKGLDSQENWILNCAGLFALGIALFPMQWNCGDACSRITPHGLCALAFFACIAYICIFRASETLDDFHNARREHKYRLTYRMLGAVMLLSPLLAFAFSSLFQQMAPFTFVIEALGVWTFATFWLVKSRELRDTKAEIKALKNIPD